MAERHRFGVSGSGGAPSAGSRSRIPLALLLGTFAACSGAEEPVPLPDRGPAPAAEPETPTAEPETPAASGSLAEGQLEPVLNFKQQRKRDALLGLDYSSGTIAVVPAERDEALAALGRAFEGREREVAAELFAEGEAQYQRNSQLDAVRAFTRSLLLDPERIETYIGLADALTMKKMTDKALAVYRRAVQIDPASADLRYRLGDYQWRHGLQAEARDSLAEVLAREPGHAGAHQKLASIHFLTGEDQAAWREIHATEAAGAPIPPQMRAQLAARTPEPARTEERR